MILRETKNKFIVKRLLTTNMPMAVCQDERFILVDTGRTKAKDALLKELNKMTKTLKLELVFLTHSHHDHIENLVEVYDAYKPKVIIHKSEKATIEKLIGEEDLLTFENELDLETLGFHAKIIHTPGHSDDSSSLIVDGEVALTGDSLPDFNTKPWATKLKVVPTMNLESFHRLLDLNCDCYIPAGKKTVHTKGQLRDLYLRYEMGERIYEL